VAGAFLVAATKELKLRSPKVISRLFASPTLCTLPLFDLCSLVLEVSLPSRSLFVSALSSSLFVHLNGSSAKDWFFMSFIFEKRVNVGLLSDF